MLVNRLEFSPKESLLEKVGAIAQSEIRIMLHAPQTFLLGDFAYDAGKHLYLRTDKPIVYVTKSGIEEYLHNLSELGWTQKVERNEDWSPSLVEQYRKLGEKYNKARNEFLEVLREQDRMESMT